MYFLALPSLLKPSPFECLSVIYFQFYLLHFFFKRASSLPNKADELIIFTSAGGVDNHTLSKREGELQIICYADLDVLNLLLFDNLKSFLTGKKIN